MSDLDVVVLTHQSADTLLDCLDSIPPALEGLSARIVIEDNASSDASQKIGQKWASARTHTPRVLLGSGPNVGYAAGNNRAVRRLVTATESLAPWLLFLNPDTNLITPLYDIVTWAERTRDVACIGALQRDASGQLIYSWDRFPSAALEWRKALRLPLAQRSPVGYQRSQIVDWVMGSFLLIRSEAFEAVGGFDERFPLYMEDVDLCKRLEASGWNTWFAANVVYRHHRRVGRPQAWREGLRWSSRKVYDHEWLTRRERISVTTALTARWLRELTRARSRDDIALCRSKISATWGLSRPQLPLD